MTLEGRMAAFGSTIPKHKYIVESGADGRKLYVFVDGVHVANQLEETYPQFFDQHDVVELVTHAHADHTTGLQHSKWVGPSSSPRRRKVVCNETTARLVEEIIGVTRSNIRVIDMGRPVRLHPSVTVTLLDANHCPGAALALLEFESGRRVLHTGDFRFSTRFQTDEAYGPLQAAVRKGIDSIYLDTTYCAPRHASIPDQNLVVEELGREVEKRRKRDHDDGVKTLFLIQTYTIGKERVIEEVARKTGDAVFVNEQKQRLLSIAGRDVYCTTDASAPVQVMKWGSLGETWPYFRPNYTAPAELAKDLGFTRVLGIVPTGWVSASQRRSFTKSTLGVDVEILLVPYSEHSSYTELQACVSWIRPRHVVPTVVGEKADEKAVSKLLSRFRGCVDEQGSKEAFIAKMTRRGDATERKKDEGNTGEVIELLDDDDQDEASTATRTASPEAMEDDDEIIIIEETSSRMPRQSNLKQASIKKYGNVVSPSPKKRKTEGEERKTDGEASKHADLDPAPAPARVLSPTSPRTAFSFSPTKKGSIQMLGSRPLLDKATTRFDPRDPEDIGFKAHTTPFAFLAEAMQMMESTSSRLAKEQILINMFRTILATDEADVLPSVFMILGRVADEQDGVELNLGGATLVRVISDAFGVSVDRVKSTYRELGDLGTVASTLKSRQTVLAAATPRSVSAMFKLFVDVANTTGKGSLTGKKRLLFKILSGCTSSAEVRYSIRALLQNMRIGANWKSVFQAFGKAHLVHRCGGRDVGATEEELIAAANRVVANYCKCPSVSRCCEAELSGDGDEVLVPTLGVPFKPMLAKPAGKGVAAAIELIRKQFASDTLVEHKYDGMRALIHVDVVTSTFKVFSRNAEDRTSTFAGELRDPLLASLADATTDAIFDAEVLAIAADGSIESFQKLSAKATNNTAVGIRIFDVLHVNGISLLDVPLRTRRARLAETVKPTDHVIGFAKATEVPVDELSCERLRELLVAALADKAEGLMIKDTGGGYSCMERSTSWLKLKKDYCEDDDTLADSIDVRVLGAWYGNGRKAGWYSPFLVAVYDEETETYQSLCRVMSGFSDAFYRDATARLGSKVVDTKPFDYDTKETPSVWFDTDEVWEIRGADLQLSPVHRAAAGIVHETKGLGLRFPRFVAIRDDKDLNDVTRSDDIAALF